MPMTKHDLSRQFFLDVCANGTVHIRERGAPMAEGTLPVFSTATRELAELVRVTHCRRAHDGSGVYRLNDPPRNDEDAVAYLGGVTELFRRTYEMFVAAEARDKATP